MNRTFDLGAATPRLILRMVGGGLHRTVTRKHRALAQQAAAARFPGQLRLVADRSLFPRSRGSEFTFAFLGDGDAMVRLRIEQGTDVGAELDQAVDTARTAATELRRQLTVLATHGFPVIGLDQRPWLAVDLTDDNVAERLLAIGAAVADWTAAAVDVVITSPGVAARAPDHDTLPTPLRLGHPGRLRVLTAAPAFVAHYPAGGGDPTLTVSRSYEPRVVFEERVFASATTWLHRTRPEAVVLQVFGAWTLPPGQVTRSAGVVLFADHPTSRPRPEHALSVVVDQNGNLVDIPTIHERVRDDRGVVHLPS
jgi:hypothetical protein